MTETPLTPLNDQSSGQSDGFVARASRALLPKGLSGKLLLLTMVFIMLTEVLIFVPSVANYRLTWLARHFTTGEAASLALQSIGPDDDGDKLREQLLDLTETEMITIRTDGMSDILASRQMPRSVDKHVAVSTPGRLAALNSIMEAFDTLIFGGDKIIRVYGPMERQEGELELIMPDGPLREAMLGYARNVMLISFLLSLGTALAVFLTLRWLLIRPLQNISGGMLAFARDPQNADVIEPSGRKDEIGVAEEQFSAMQKQVRGTMSHQRNLADLGLAVSKINHDLRNILASASLFSDRLTSLEDPTVQRLAPRLVRTIDRAVDYTRSVLAYGKAGEEEPTRSVVRLHRLLEDVAQVLALDLESEVDWENLVAEDLELDVDADQMFRVLLNLCRNSYQVMTADSSVESSVVKRISVAADQNAERTELLVSDTGPGFPGETRDTIFSAFKGSSRSGGTGLGLAIAADLVRAHNGTIELLDSNQPGAQFKIVLPR